MKMLIQISHAYHERLVSQLVDKSALYYTLMNGMKIVSPGADETEKVVEFICDADEAQRLVETAKQCCPEAASQIAAGKALPMGGN